MLLTTAQAIVKFLDNQYVEFDGKTEKFVEGVFTLYGHGIVVGLGEALANENHSLKIYQGKNEQGMAHTAIAFAKQNNRRKIIACASSIGPGCANMVTAAATATVNCIPLLLFSGDTFATRQPDPVLQQIEQPFSASVTTTDCFKPVTKYWDRLLRPEMAMSAMLNAVRVLTDPENVGAVMISLPQDVQGETYDFPDSFLEKRVHKIRRYPAVEDDIRYLKEALFSAKRPLFICGGGVRYSQAGKTLQDICEKHYIPYAETQSGKSATKSSCVMNLGGIGVTGNSCANKYAVKADLVVGLGTRFSDFTTSSKSLFPNAKIVTVNLSLYHGEKLDAYCVKGDVKSVLCKLEKELNGLSFDDNYVKEIKAEWDREVLRLSKLDCAQLIAKSSKSGKPNTEKEFYEMYGSAITQTQALHYIMKNIGEGIVVAAAGSLPGDMQRIWQTDNTDSYNMEYGYSCMGYEIAGALGSKLARSDAEVYALCGDGSFLMLHSELITSIQENQKITVILFDNCGFGCINSLQTGKGINSDATEFRFRKRLLDGSLMKIDYAVVARGYGAAAYTVTNLKELENALKNAKKEKKSTLIDIKVLPKSMTDGYGAWWNTGTAEVSKSAEVQQATEENLIMRGKAKKY